MNIDSPIIVSGLSIRTSPGHAATDIPALWQRFLASKPVGVTYAVYTDYESDWTGAYTVVLGVEGKNGVMIPAGAYERFAAHGDPTQVIWKAWRHINTQWERRGERRYAADFERYNAPGECDIFIGLRS